MLRLSTKRFALLAERVSPYVPRTSFSLEKEEGADNHLS